MKYVLCKVRGGASGKIHTLDLYQVGQVPVMAAKRESLYRARQDWINTHALIHFEFVEKMAGWL